MGNHNKFEIILNPKSFNFLTDINKFSIDDTTDWVGKFICINIGVLNKTYNYLESLKSYNYETYFCGVITQINHVLNQNENSFIKME